MAEKCKITIAVIGIDIGKNSFHVVGLDPRGAIALRQRWSRGQVETRLANMAPCLVGMGRGLLSFLVGRAGPGHRTTGGAGQFGFLMPRRVCNDAHACKIGSASRMASSLGRRMATIPKRGDESI
jgi:hypothetical protein